MQKPLRDRQITFQDEPREQRIIIPVKGETVNARGVYLFDCCLTRVANVIKRSKSRIKLNANTTVDVLLDLLLKLSKAHFKMAIVWVSKYT